ncbi:hypothetical protein Hanom_Chr04g00286191 [Helianthus anomalus]
MTESVFNVSLLGFSSLRTSSSSLSIREPSNTSTHCSFNPVIFFRDKFASRACFALCTLCSTSTETSPRRFVNPLSSFIAKPTPSSMMILVIVCRPSNSPIPNGSFSNGVFLMSKCRNRLSFKKLLGNLLKFSQPKTINVCKL